MPARESIIEAFTQLLGEKPYDQITVLEICKRAGVSNKSLYRHFDGKQAIVREIIREDWTAPVYKVREALPLDTIPSATSMMVERSYQLVHDRRQLYRNLLLNYDRAQLDADFKDVLSEFNADVFSRNGIGGTELSFVVMIFSAMQTPILHWWLLENEDVSPKEVARYHVDWSFGRWRELMPEQGS